MLRQRDTSWLSYCIKLAIFAAGGAYAGDVAAIAPNFANKLIWRHAHEVIDTTFNANVLVRGRGVK